MYAVLFDIDGTLLRTGGAGHVAFVETFRDVFQIVDFPAGVPFAGRSDRAIATDVMQLSGIDPSLENWEHFIAGYQQRLDRILADLEGEVLPGVVDVLDRLAADDHAVVGLLTGNTSFGARAKTVAYGLAERFHFGGYGDQRTDRNQIAADARQAAEDFVAEQSGEDSLCGTMVIGDTPADVVCGRAIDAFVVAVATGGSSHDER
ncbi:MAG: HAD family hydrolase, partial [Bythopirellula sp.]